MHNPSTGAVRKTAMADEKRLLSPSWDWLLDRGFMKSLGLVADPAVAGAKLRRTLGLRPRAQHRFRDIAPRSIRSSALHASDEEKSKLVKRLSRISGQVDALRRAIVEHDAPTTKLLQQATACRGALDGFIAEVIEDHIRQQVVEAETKGDASRAAEELIGIVHSYLT